MSGSFLHLTTNCTRYTEEKKIVAEQKRTIKQKLNSKNVQRTRINKTVRQITTMKRKKKYRKGKTREIETK